MSDPAARKTAWKSWAWALAIAGFVGLRIWSRTGRDQPAPTGPNPLLPYLPHFAVAAVALYALLLGTNALTFRFDKPVWTGLKLRLYGLSVAWLLCTLGVLVLGLDPYGAAATIAVCAFAGALWMYLWFRVQRTVLLQRLHARGVDDEQVVRGALVTLAPAGPTIHSSIWRDFEAGAIWREGSQLRLVGDVIDLVFEPGAIRSEILPGTFAALLGRKGLAMTLALPDGPMPVKIEPHGMWTPLGWMEGVERISAKLAL
jgi:hypothetical protein